MIVKRIIKEAEDGTYSATLMLTEEQTAFLVQFALGYLVQEGTIKVFDLKEGEPVPEDKELELAQDFLANVDPKKIGQA